MRSISVSILVLLATFLSSCNTPAVVTVGAIQVKSSGRVGGKGGIYAKSAAGDVVQVVDNNEDSFRAGAGVVKFGLGAWAATDIFSTGSAAYQSVKNTKTAADVTTTGLKETTKQVGLKEVTAQKALALEEAALLGQ